MIAGPARKPVLGKQQQKQPYRADCTEEQETQGISASGHFPVSADPPAAGIEATRSGGVRIKERGHPLEHPSDIEAYRLGESDYEDKKNDIFDPAHRIFGEQ